MNISLRDVLYGFPRGNSCIIVQELDTLLPKLRPLYPVCPGSRVPGRSRIGNDWSNFLGINSTSMYYFLLIISRQSVWGELSIHVWIIVFDLPEKCRIKIYKKSVLVTD